MATKSTGVGRGGKRPGAGRKPNPAISARQTTRSVENAADVIAQARQEPRLGVTAVDLVAKAYATLEDVMDNSPFPAPRVTAARAVLDLAKEEKAEKTGATGKKAERQASAERTAAEGRFAVPQAPRMVQ